MDGCWGIIAAQGNCLKGLRYCTKRIDLPKRGFHQVPELAIIEEAGDDSLNRGDTRVASNGEGGVQTLAVRDNTLTSIPQSQKDSMR